MHRTEFLTRICVDKIKCGNLIYCINDDLTYIDIAYALTHENKLVLVGAHGIFYFNDTQSCIREQNVYNMYAITHESGSTEFHVSPKGKVMQIDGNVDIIMNIDLISVCKVENFISINNGIVHIKNKRYNKETDQIIINEYWQYELRDEVIMLSLEQAGG